MASEQRLAKDLNYREGTQNLTISLPKLNKLLACLRSVFSSVSVISD
jgi:hypothetical protein